MKSNDGWAQGFGFLSSSGALFAIAWRWRFGERACAVRCWGWLRSRRTLRGAAWAGKRRVSGRATPFRHALPAGAPDPRARCYHLQNIWGSTLGTVTLEEVASRVRRALVATRRRPLHVVDSPSTSSGHPMGCTPSELRSFRMRTSFRNVPHVKMILAAGPHGPTFIPGGRVEAPSLISREFFGCWD